MDYASIAWIASIIIRSFAVAFSGLLYTFTTLLFVYFIVSAVFRSFRNQFRPYSEIAGLTALSLIQIRLYMSCYGSALAKLALIPVAIGFLIETKTKQKRRQEIWRWALFITVVLTAVLPDRTFHRIFRSGTYEAYITEKFPEGSEELERLIRENYTPTTVERDASHRYLEEAVLKEQEGDLESALQSINLALEKDPYAARAYLVRGKMRLTRLELNEKSALAASKDLARSIQLDSSQAAAYLYHALATTYRPDTTIICKDIRTCIQLDSSLEIHTREMAQRYCR